MFTRLPLSHPPCAFRSLVTAFFSPQKRIPPPPPDYKVPFVEKASTVNRGS